MEAPPSRPRYLHGHDESVLVSHRWRNAANSCDYLISSLAPGVSVLDVGCGPGTITVDLAQLVAPGVVVALDTEPAMVAATKRLATARGVANVAVAVADAAHLPWPDDSFDVVHLHQVLQHVSDPRAVLAECRRVCRRDGVVAARDADYAGFVWSPDDPDLDRWRSLYDAVARRSGGEPNAGRHLVRWAEEVGFQEIEASASAWVFRSAEERRWWGESWARRALESGYARSALEHALARREDLEAISAAWSRWAHAPSGWLLIPHGELLARG